MVVKADLEVGEAGLNDRAEEGLALVLHIQVVAKINLEGAHVSTNLERKKW